jgi:hypothetical protein
VRDIWKGDAEFPLVVEELSRVDVQCFQKQLVRQDVILLMLLHRQAPSLGRDAAQESAAIAENDFHVNDFR